MKVYLFKFKLFALRKTKIAYNFGLSECSRVKEMEFSCFLFCYRAFEGFVDCLGSMYYCTDTEMRNYMNKNIHDIGAAWLTNSTEGLYSYLGESLYHFDPYQCDGKLYPK